MLIFNHWSSTEPHLNYFISVPNILPIRGSVSIFWPACKLTSKVTAQRALRRTQQKMVFLMYSLMSNSNTITRSSEMNIAPDISNHLRSTEYLYFCLFVFLSFYLFVFLSFSLSVILGHLRYWRSAQINY